MNKYVLKCTLDVHKTTDYGLNIYAVVCRPVLVTKSAGLKPINRLVLYQLTWRNGIKAHPKDFLFGILARNS